MAMLTVACGAGSQLGSAFSTEWQNDGGRSIAALQRELSAPTAPAGAGVVVGVNGAGVVAVTLSGQRWDRPGRLDSRPVIAGDVVLLSGGGRLTALAAATGAELWSIESGGRALRGAGDDGQLTAASLGALNGGRSRLVVVERSGAVRLSAEPEVEIGAPAVLGGVVFVPWANQYVSAIDGATGAERGRLLTRRQVSRALTLGDGLYFGESELLRFDEQVGQAASGGGSLAVLPRREFPGNPRWFTPGAEVLPPKASAPDRVRRFALPKGTGKSGVSFDGDRFAVTYFRVAMGASAKDGVVRWARSMPKDVLGGAAVSGGFVLCSEDGKVSVIDGQTGAESASLALSGPLESCEAHGGSYQVPSKAAERTLAEQITEIVASRDAQMVPAQRFLMQELVRLPDDSVTQALIELATRPDAPPLLGKDAREALAGRRSGAEAMLAALEREYDFLEDVLLPPPVGPLADALLAMKETRAAPALARHLNDPANAADDIMRAARALEQLASASELSELQTFFALYRATAVEAPIVQATISVARAIARTGGAEGLALLRQAAKDPFTHVEVKEAIDALEAPTEKTAGR
ncbi:MAG: PQQ-binding-like beta-propeller repeat protein [Polyangiaceae bacterium]|nr:PQQ-binding-like beta-propeller repeat protein [Polyangiaceae bacterium]MCW5792119.1 PQQ-binding-like beta-propeller repeat protein [Polyangiaceae bacterium]